MAPVVHQISCTRVSVAPSGDDGGEQRASQPVGSTIFRTAPFGQRFGGSCVMDPLTVFSSTFMHQT
jgi:hypothetical protein